ncbi:hypothetical protein BGZ58_009294 [Dissophora ornata]|nr:hypothetical protein BGZ58_009294 [Dissophora ornata]
MGVETVSTHTAKGDTTTTIVSEHEEVVHPKEGHGIVENARRTFRDHWFPSPFQNEGEEDDDIDESDIHYDPSLLRSNSVMRRAYDYWKTLTQGADDTAKEIVIEARKARDEAAAEAKWAVLGFKQEARKKYEAAEKKYREALEAAERAHEEAHEKAKSKWFHAMDTTEREVDNVKDQASEITHEKWDRFKSAVNSLAFNPPKYGCSPSSQYWFSRQPSAGWDCREIWDHPSRHDHRHQSIKTLPKKYLPVDRIHDALTDLWNQARGKARNSPSVTSFDSSLKPVKDHYHDVLDRVYCDEQDAIEELDSMFDKVKAKLNEAKYYEEQTDSWLISQWNAVIDNTGEIKDQYGRVFQDTLKSIKHSRADIYNSLLNNLQRSINVARNNINDAYRTTKDQADKLRLHKAINDATDSFSNAIKDAEAKIKTAPKQTYENALETFNRDTAHLKAKLEHVATVASRSASSASQRASKSASSLSTHASKSASSLSHHGSKSASSLSAHASKSVSSAISQASRDAKSFAGDAQKSYQAATDKARDGYEQAAASVSSTWDSATPFPHKAQHQYHKMLGTVHERWFDERNHNDASVSSVYGTILVVYFLSLAYRIWRNRRLNRMTDPKETTFAVVKSGDGPHGKHITKIQKFKSKPSAEEILEKKRNSFGTVLTQFTSVVPVTLILLVILELSGLTRVALHTLFLSLVTSQLLQSGLMNGPLTQMGIVDGVHSSGCDIGMYMSWGVLGVTALANAIKILPY